MSPPGWEASPKNVDCKPSSLSFEKGYCMLNTGPQKKDTCIANFNHRGDKIEKCILDTLPETNSSPLKIDPWNLGESYWKPIHF